MTYIEAPAVDSQVEDERHSIPLVCVSAETTGRHLPHLLMKAKYVLAAKARELRYDYTDGHVLSVRRNVSFFQKFSKFKILFNFF